ncbi:sacsin N-terminal ATP-binding-like domain-containing protein [Kitasatospora sp. NPDC048298]|uniref:sacsin N-terminal ATP-binding-like domain-containing protein n=1 Tax=Kitasatospora sp. NPDC048298 TaxID=3364049 RepID=UPI00371A4705
MTRGGNDDELAEAVRALLADEPDPGVEARTPEEAARAVRLFNEGIAEVPKLFRRVAEGAQRGAETLSSDKLQVLSEMVQNADDTGAREIRFHWRPTELLAAHNGSGLRLADIPRLGLPWVTGKSQDSGSTGRFGIGLATLRMLSTSWEVHGHPYHVRFADVTLAPADPPLLPADISGREWTVFRIPLGPGVISAEELLAWFENWQDSSLLFLRRLEQVTVATDGTAGPGPTRVLRLSWQDVTTLRLPVDGAEQAVRVREARTTGGRLWRVYDTLVPSRPGWHRLHKKLGETVPVAVALPMDEAATGYVHAGLPVAPLAVPARVHSQFDPVVSREGFAASALNSALVPVVADLWQAAVLDVLGRVEPSAWHLLPLTAASALGKAGLPERLVGAFLERAREQVAGALALPVPDGRAVPLADLAVEAEELTGVISEWDTAQLAELERCFPAAARDQDGRWRAVLSDWRAVGAVDLPDEVEVSDAIGLLKRPSYDVDRTVRLTAAALDAGLEYTLCYRACLATVDGQRLAPYEHRFAGRQETGLLDPLGILRDLHPAYWNDDEAARRVTGWLRRSGYLVRRDDTAAVLGRIAHLGGTSSRLPTPEISGTDQLVLLQRALAELPASERERLGPGIGRTVRLDAYEYEADGEEKTCQAAPDRLYLPRALESAGSDRFATAARKTPGLLWAHRSYAKTLLSVSRSGGLSPTAFLRLLGVADTPRLAPVVRGLMKKYERSHDKRIGLPHDTWPSPAGRHDAMARLRATHTLNDQASPDLDRVVRNIVMERNVSERRRRTAALLHSLGKPITSREATVEAATAYHGWTVKGSVPALWVWNLRDIAWLEDEKGVLRRPGRLQLRTPDAEALYGQDEPNYLHAELQHALSNRAEVRTALGVAGDPDIPQLIGRLRKLRKRPLGTGAAAEELKTEVYLVYRALARRLTERPADTPRAQVEKRVAAALGGDDALVLTDLGWRSPDDCFRGTAILYGMRAFVPPGAELLPLWQVLGIEEPGPEDLVEVLKELAADGVPPGRDQQRLMLEALRSLNRLVGGAGASITPGLRSKLNWLPLWTSTGWTKQRPIYAVAAHRSVEVALDDRVPLWQPGGDTEQFAGLLGLLKVQQLDMASAEAVEPDTAMPDSGLTESFRRAVTTLQDRLVRDEPEAADSFTEWAWLTGLEVRVLPGLRVRADLGKDREPSEIPVGAHIDRSAKALFLSAPSELSTRPGTGAAVACHFRGFRGLVARHWRDFWEEEALTTGHAVPLTSSSQRDFEEQQRRNELLRDRSLRSATAPAKPDLSPNPARVKRRTSAKPTAPVPAPRSAPDGTTATAPAPALPEPRNAAVPEPPRLVRIDLLGQPTVRLTGSASSTTGGPVPAQPRHGSRTRAGGLSMPRPGGAVPREQSARHGYQDSSSKEALVIRTLAAVLGEDAESLDQRGQQNVGADAVDSAGRYYEIKAHGGARPSDVTLTAAEYKRAWEQGENYVLVIAEHLNEGSGGKSALTLISDPLAKLDPEPVSDVRLKGLRGADLQAKVWEWPTTT